MTKPVQRSFSGSLHPVCLALVFLTLLFSAMPALAQFQPSVLCPAERVRDIPPPNGGAGFYADWMCDPANGNAEVRARASTCSPCVCVRMVNADQQKKELDQKQLRDTEGLQSLLPWVDRMNSYMDRTIGCRTNWATNPVWTGIFALINGIGAVSDWGGLLSGAFALVLQTVMNQIISQVMNLACAALAFAVSQLASLICLPFLNFDFNLPKYAFNFPTGATCNGYPLGVFTAVPPPAAPLFYSSVPRITYRNKIHLITP